MATGIRETYPQEFGRYYLTTKIAMGGMAEIFRAKSVGAEGFEKVVVIKRILPHFCEDESFITMFQDEARVAAHLNHANVVQIFDFEQVEGLYYIAMEYVEGEDLKRVLDAGTKEGRPLSIAQAVQVMIEAGQGLDYAHKREVDGKPLNIIHRDISPHNMMVSYNGEVKIMDFGIAKAASRSTKTRVGTVKGKCAYMSPEQARGKPLDGRSDLFALGVCLWEMLAGKRLFVGDSDFETLNNVLRMEAPSLTEMNPDVPTELDAIVAKSLAKDRDERQADVAEFVADLRRWFYTAVPDPSAISLKNYLHELFNEQILKLKSDVAAEAEALSALRTNSGLRRPTTNSRQLAAASDEDATVALDTSAAGLMGGDEEATVALDTAAAGMLLGEQSSASAPAKKSNTGLIVGLGVVVAGIAVAVGLMAAGVFDKGKSPKTGGAVASADPGATNQAQKAAKVVKYTVHIRAPGAKKIEIDGQTEATSDSLDFQVPKGETIKILAIGDGGEQLKRFTADKDDQTVTIDLPKPKAKEVGGNTIAVIRATPANSIMKINGKAVSLVGGSFQMPKLKAGTSVSVELQAAGYKPMQKVLTITKDSGAELFELALEKDKPAAAKKPVATGPGKVSINAIPWARVTYKGKTKMTPATFTKVPAGRQTFTLKGPGGVTKKVTLSVRSGRTSSKSVHMR
ncbi:MAG TPA: hypothetical protein DCQ06_13865 [Myxococcales bacterium]|nr:hypothetical protein [Myxococcales bacterium]HAN32677.1 hypothetical protein [Myxococcales bacterium]